MRRVTTYSLSCGKLRAVFISFFYLLKQNKNTMDSPEVKVIFKKMLALVPIAIGIKARQYNDRPIITCHRQSKMIGLLFSFIDKQFLRVNSLIGSNHYQLVEAAANC